MNTKVNKLNLEFIFLFISLFSIFFLWDIKNYYIDLRFLVIFISTVYFIIYFKSLNFKIDYLITSIIIIILIHYYLNVIFKSLDFDKNIIFFTIYLLISYYYFKFQKIEFSIIFYAISKTFLIVIFFNILININNFILLENTQSGACGLFTNYSDLNFTIFAENSHFGMVAPGAIFCFLFSIKEGNYFKFKNIIFYILILALSLFIFSMTFLLGLIVAFLGLIFSLSKKNYKLFLIPIILVAFSISSIFLKESCVSRLERMELFTIKKYLDNQKKFNVEINNSINEYNNFEKVLNTKNNFNLDNCSEFKKNSSLISLKKKELKTLEDKIKFNSDKIKKFNKSTDYLYTLQIETRKFKEQKNNILKDLQKILSQNISTEMFSKCKINFNDNDDKLQKAYLKIDDKLNNSQKLIEEIIKADNKIVISESRFKNPNITTQVYQISLFNTYSSIIDNPLGWGYNNYAYSHFKYVSDNIIRLNLETQVEVEKMNNDIKLIDIDNLQDPDIFYLNYNDGRNNFSKLITEFGYLSIIIFIFLVIFALSKKVNIIEKSFLIPIIGTQLGSGAGYINGGFAIAIILTLIIYRKSINKI